MPLVWAYGSLLRVEQGDSKCATQRMWGHTGRGPGGVGSYLGVGPAVHQPGAKACILVGGLRCAAPRTFGRCTDYGGAHGPRKAAEGRPHRCASTGRAHAHATRMSPQHWGCKASRLRCAPVGVCSGALLPWLVQGRVHGAPDPFLQLWPRSPAWSNSTTPPKQGLAESLELARERAKRWCPHGAHGLCLHGGGQNHTHPYCLSHTASPARSPHGQGSCDHKQA
jgi:hypothetical protein